VAINANAVSGVTFGTNLCLNQSLVSYRRFYLP
jgi:hypothetical protein